MTNQVAVIIVAAGRGARMQSTETDLPKQYLDLGGRTILTQTLSAFLGHPDIYQVVVVRHVDDGDLYDQAVQDLETNLIADLLPSVVGGATRQLSVSAGLKALTGKDCTSVLIHDAARPFVSSDVINNVIEKLRKGNVAVLPAVPVFDTLKRQVPATSQLETVDRTHLWTAQTPQGFNFETILSAHMLAETQGKLEHTDDTSVVEAMRVPVVLAEGSPENIKITTLPDLERARKKVGMTHSLKSDPVSSATPKLSELLDVRIGTGYDVHAFDDGDAVILGGHLIPHSKKLKGHSDADVVLHAITDAVLGSIGDGDIGTHFPPSDPKWKSAASDQFLLDAIRRVHELGGRVAHIDVTIICEAPKIGPHRQDMRAAIAGICDLPVSRVSVKATTSERLGFTGRREGIASMAAVTVRLPFAEDDAV
ncbi:bifunctional 2-C-methyl-D-erythritol 4-phosphate cytidylyltransferase/2-C-methyl-D-erythritol 2,4-cyclodiphosphate synthase [Roseibium algae]|uniref:Bifunctional enzyme IspD/IspF n=1 Tax=Roseibium algae TaxID=3123038 RepID=A0ABU8TSW0_9HYPH